MKKNIFLIFLLMFLSFVQAKSENTAIYEFGSSCFWIGAIRSDSAHIPAGKRFLSWEMGTPE